MKNQAGETSRRTSYAPGYSCDPGHGLKRTIGSVTAWTDVDAASTIMALHMTRAEVDWMTARPSKTRPVPRLPSRKMSVPWVPVLSVA
jgi:hypothetical protein